MKTIKKAVRWLASVMLAVTGWNAASAAEYTAANQDEFVSVAGSAESGDRILLGEGSFAIGPVDIDGKTLTFAGAGQAKTTVYIGNGGYDGNGGHGSNKSAKMTFEDLTLDDLASDSGYLTGFTEAAGLTFRNVTFGCGFSNWGNKGGAVSFYNCTFNPVAVGRYNVQELRSASGTQFLFDGCVFNSAEGRFINAYKQGGAEANIGIVVKDCTFKNTGDAGKCALNLKDGKDGCTIALTFVGENKTEGEFPALDESTKPSRLFATAGAGNATVMLKATDDDDPVVIYASNRKIEGTWVDPDGYRPISVVVAQVGGKAYGTLEAAIAAAIAANDGVAVELVADLDLTGASWTPVEYRGGRLTIDGKGFTVKGLSAGGLLKKTGSGGHVLTVRNITFDQADVTDVAPEYAAVICGYCDSMPSLTFENVTVRNSKVTGTKYAGAFVSYYAAYYAEDRMTFRNCTVENCTITGEGSVGAIVGHANGNVNGIVTVEGATITGNTITSTGDSKVKAGAVCGTVGSGAGMLVDATVSGNTVTSCGATITTIYGRQGAAGTLTVTGGTYDAAPIAEADATWAKPAEGYQVVKTADGKWTVGVKAAEETEAVITTKPQESKVEVDPQVGIDVAVVEKIEAGTKVEGVKLTAVAQGAKSGVASVVAAAKATDAAFAAAVEAADEVSVKVTVEVRPTEYVAPAGETKGKVAFALTPKATVTVGEGDGAQSKEVAVSNAMIDQSHKIAVSIYTGFAPAAIGHYTESGALIENFGEGDIAYDAATGVATVLISHFSTLVAAENKEDLPEPVAAKILETGMSYPTLAAAFEAATDGQTVELLAASYGENNLADIAKLGGKAVTVVGQGMDQTELKVVYGTNASDVNGLNFKNLTLTIDHSQKSSMQYTQTLCGSYDGVKIKGMIAVDHGTSVFTNCTFAGSTTGDEYLLWVYAGKAIVTYCNFEKSGSKAPIKVYGETSFDCALAVDHTTFAEIGEKGSTIYSSNNNNASASSSVVYELTIDEATIAVPEETPIVKPSGSGLSVVNPTKDENGGLTGGTFITANTNPETIEAIIGNVVAEGYMPKKNDDGTYGVKEKVYVAHVGEAKFETLQAAVDAAHEMTGDVTIRLTGDVKECVLVHQKEGLNLTIDGNDKARTITGQIIIDGNGRFNGTDTLTISGINFVGTKNDLATGTDAFIYVSSAAAHLTGGKYNYAHNVTIDNCTFTGDAEAPSSIVAFKCVANAGMKGLVIANSSATKVHSLAQLTGVTGATFSGCTLTEAENGVNISGGDGTCVLEDNTFLVSTTDGYGVRLKDSTTVVATLKEGNEIKAATPLVIGKNAETGNKGQFVVEGGTYEGAIAKISTSSDAAFAISGGTFSQEFPQEFCAPGCEMVANDDGTFGIDKVFYQDSENANLWHVKNLGGLKMFRDAVNGGNDFAGKTIMLDGDIDLAAEENWEPIGTAAHPFAGHFDGRKSETENFKISNVKIEVNAPELTGWAYVGFFGLLKGGSDASIANVDFDSLKVVANVGAAKANAGVAGGIYNTKGVSNVHVTNGDVWSSGSYVGGIAGYTGYCEISDCSFSGKVHTERAQVGAIAGFSEGGRLLRDSAEAEVTAGNTWAGGIIGSFMAASGMGCLEDCTFVGTVESTNPYYGPGAGGICGVFAIDGADAIRDVVVGNYSSAEVKSEGQEIDVPLGNLNSDDANDLAMVQIAKANSWDMSKSDRTEMTFVVYNAANEPISETVTEARNANLVGSAEDLKYVGDGVVEIAPATTLAGMSAEELKEAIAESSEGDVGDVFINDDGKVEVRLATAKIGTQPYMTLAEAIADVTSGQTVTMVTDTTTGGISIPSGKDFTLDFNGKTVAFECPGAGSAGTKTCGFQILKDSTIVFKNGKLCCTEANKTKTWVSTDTTKGIALLIQNYANLTLENMVIDGENIAHNGAAKRYVMSNNSGAVKIDGTTITPAEGDIAFDTCKYGTYALPTVEVTGESVIGGDVELSGGNLKLTSGTLDGELLNGGIGEGVVTKAETFEVEAPADYKWDADGKLVAKDYVAQVGEAKFETLAEAIDAATAGQTVTLIADTTLTAAVQIGKKVTIDLATFKVTAAAGCNAIEVVANGELTVNADQENPGYIVCEAGKNCIYADNQASAGKKSIVINNGVFDGACVFNEWGSAHSGQTNPKLDVKIYGGTFNEEVTGYRCYYFWVYGGTFKKRCEVGTTSTCCARYHGGKFRVEPGSNNPGAIGVGDTDTTKGIRIYYAVYFDGEYYNVFNPSAPKEGEGDVVENAVAKVGTTCYYLSIADALAHANSNFDGDGVLQDERLLVLQKTVDLTGLEQRKDVKIDTNGQTVTGETVPAEENCVVVKKDGKIIVVDEAEVVATIGEGTEKKSYLSLVDAFAAVQDGETITLLKDETFTTCAAQNKTFTIKGTGKTDGCVKVSFPGTTTMTGCNVTFQDLIIEKPSATTYQGFHHISSETYVNCLIKGEIWNYGETLVYKDCNFVQTANAYCPYVYGSRDVLFDGCTFDVAGKAIKIGKDESDPAKVVVSNCSFATSVAKKPAVMIDVHANQTTLLMDTESNTLGETYFTKNADGTFKVEGGKPYYFAEEHAWNAQNHKPDGTSEEVFMEETGAERKGYVAVGKDIVLDEDGKIVGGEFKYVVPEFLDEGLMAEFEGTTDPVTGEKIYVLTEKVALIGDKSYSSLDAAVAAAQDGETITLFKDVEIPAGYALAKNLTLDLNGKTFTTAAATIEKGLKVVDGSEPKAGRLVVGGVIGVAAEATLDVAALGYGTVGLVGGQAGSLAIAAGGTAVLMDAWAGVPVNFLKANSGDFIAPAEGAKVKLGGTTYAWNGEMFLAESAVAKTAVSYGGKTFEEGFDTLAAALAAAADGGTVTLLKSVEGPGLYFKRATNGKSLTVDFGGFTYTCNELVGDNGTVNQGMHLEGTGTFVFKDGTIKVDDSVAAQARFVIQNYMDLVLDNMTIDGENLALTTGTRTDVYALAVNVGEVTLQGGTTLKASTADGTTAYALDCDDHSWGKANVIVNGATITGNVSVEGGDLDLQSGTLDGVIVKTDDLGDSVIKKADGFAAEAPTDYKWVDGVLTAKVYVAQVEGGAKFETLAEAIVAAASGETVTLLADCEGSGMTINKSVTIDFAGKTYTCVGPAAGSTGTKNQVFQLLKDNTVVLKGGTVKVADDVAGTFRFIIQNYANTTLDGMTLDASNVSYSDASRNDVYAMSCNSGAVAIKGGSELIAPTGENLDAFALDTAKNANYALPTVTVSGESTLTGDVSLSGGNLALEFCTLSGELVETWDGVQDGVVSKAADVVAAAPEGYLFNAEGYLSKAFARIDEDRYASLAEAFEAATAEDTVTLIRNVEAAQTLANAQGTLDLNGCTIETATGTALKLTGATTLTLKDSSEEQSGAIVGQTALQLEVGADDAALAISGGTLMGTTALRIAKPAKFKGTPGACTVAVSGGMFSGAIADVLDVLAGAFTGGHFDRMPDAAYPAEGYQARQLAGHEGLYEICIDWTAKIVDGDGNLKGEYVSLAAAIAEVADGDTIVMLKNVEKANGISVASGSNFTVDFAGHTYLVEKPGAGSSGTKTQAFQLLRDSMIVFKNGVIGCTEENATVTWDSSSEVKGVAMIIQNYANLTLDNMVIDAKNIAHNGGNVRYAVSVNSGDVEIKDTVIVVCDGDFAFDSCLSGSYAQPTVTVDGGSITGKVELTGGKVELVSGTLVGEIVCTEATAGDVTKSDDFDALATEGYVWKDGKLAVAVAEIGGVKFASLADAIAAVGEGETIVMLKDVEKANGISVASGKNFTVDFGGHTYLVEKPGAGSSGTKTQAFQLLKDSTIVFKNGTIGCTEDNAETRWESSDQIKGVAMIIQNYANLTLDNMVIDAKNIAHNGDNVRYAVSVNSGDVAIKDTVIAAYGGDFAFDSCLSGSYAQPTVTVEGGAITGKVELAGGKVVLVSGTLEGEIVCTEATAGDVTKGDGFDAAAAEGYVWKDGKLAVAVAEIGDVKFASLADAIAAVGEGETIVMLKDVEKANGISVASGSNFTVDFAGHTYLVEKPGAGSSGTKTQAFQLLKDSTIVFKNGTIGCTEENAETRWESSDQIKGVAMIIQNYANLTLDNMVIDAKNIAHNGDNVRYAVSVNSGDVAIKDTVIAAYDGDFAFDSCLSGSYAQPTVTVDGGSITGKVELAGGKVKLVSGTLEGEIVCTEATAGDVTKGDGFDAAAAEGYVWKDGKLATAVAQIGDEKFASLADAIAAVGEGETATITMLENVTLAEIVTVGVEAEITLDTNGKTLEFTDGAAALVVSGSADLTIVGDGAIVNSGENYEDGGYAVVVDSADARLTLDGATLEGEWAGVAVMAGDYVQLSGAVIGYNAIEVGGEDNVEPISVNIQGGSVETTDADWGVAVLVDSGYIAGEDFAFAIAGGTFKGDIAAYDDNDLAGTISGGKFSAAVDEDWLHEDFELVNVGTGDYPYMVASTTPAYAPTASFGKVGNDVTLVWEPSESGVYQIEYTDALGESADWNTAVEWTQATTVTLPDQTAPARFYRVRTLSTVSAAD